MDAKNHFTLSVLGSVLNACLKLGRIQIDDQGSREGHLEQESSTEEQGSGNEVHL